jgi:hypothetical protein
MVVNDFDFAQAIYRQQSKRYRTRILLPLSSPIGARKYEVVSHPRAFRRTGLRPKWTTRWSPMMTAVAVTSTIGV